MRLVFDTSVPVAAIRSRTGASYELMSRALRHEFTLLMSVPLALEYEEVLTRPEQLAAAWITREEVEILVAGLLGVAIRIDPPAYNVPSLPDERDRHVLSLAIGGNADALVTHNLRHFRGFVELFGVDLLTPGELLRRLRS